MQIATREERYLKAIDNSRLCEDLCRKLRILTGDPENLSKKTLDEWDDSCPVPVPREMADEGAWIEEQRMIERMQRAVGHM